MTVARLVADRRIEEIPVDDEFAANHLDRAAATLQQAELLTDAAIQERLHYEAGLHVALALLAHDGYRLRNAPGHHESAVAYLGARLVATPAASAALDLDSMRRSRNGELYRAVIVGEQVAAASAQTAATLLAHVHDIVSGR